MSASACSTSGPDRGRVDSNHYASDARPVNAAPVAAYLAALLRGGLVQPFGCLLAVRPASFSLLAYSANAPALLGLPSPAASSLLSTDARSLFTPVTAAALSTAAASKDLSFINPVWVQSISNRRPYYAVLHRIDVGLVIDLEPASCPNPGIAHSIPALKLAALAIARLHSLPAGDVGALCDAVVEHVQRLTGYDRVMAYKFHDDEHGEVVSEIRRADLEPFLGLHYPATDVPQAARLLFERSRVRIIVDCAARPVPVVQDRSLKRPLCLAGSTLRAPHGCHAQYMANMGSAASLVMAVLVSDGGGSTKLWGLVVCHHTSPRYVPFPVRYACEFLMQAFGLQLNLELQLHTQMAEKKILRTQMTLCDMLLRDVPLGIVNQSPSIMDLVKCNGAALVIDGKCYRLGLTPGEEQIGNIVEWLLAYHGDSTGFVTESLEEAGYPGAADLENAICGMAAARIVSKDFLFWFRCQTAREIKWGGERHEAEAGHSAGRMNPRLSFNVFLEIVKNRSLPWETMEMDAIRSLQLIVRDSFINVRDNIDKMMVSADDVETGRMNELSLVACEMVRLIETARAPIIAVDAAGIINGWNARAAELTGLPAQEAMGKSLLHEIVHEHSRKVVQDHLHRALQGSEDNNIEVKLRTFGLQQKKSTVIIMANACPSKDCSNNIVGVCFVGQDVTREKAIMDKSIRMQGDYKAIIESVNPLIPPIFASDENTRCSEWNSAMERLTGWTREEVIGGLLIGEIFGGFCQMKSDDALTKFMILLRGAIDGKDIEKAPFAFLDKEGKHVKTVLTAYRRTDMGGNVIGCFCFLQPVSSDLQQALDLEQQQEKKWLAKLKELAYIKQEIRNPLHGIQYTHRLLESTTYADIQRQFLETSTACERQLMKIVEDMDLQGIENGRLELDMAWFTLGNIMDAVFGQVMLPLNEKHLELISKIPQNIRTMNLYGDQCRLQQVLTDFLLYIVNHATSKDRWLEIEVLSNLKKAEIQSVHLQFRITHPGLGIHSEYVQDMFSESRSSSEEGHALNISRKLLELMNGSLQCVREPTRSYFLIDIEMQTTECDARI